MGRSFLLLFMLIFISAEAYSTPTSLMYQGRIVKSDGRPLEASNVSFIFQITSPSGACVVYQERVTGINMANSGGVFDVPIGKGSVGFPLAGATSVLNAFDNDKTYTCGDCSGYVCTNGTSTYAPVNTDGRLLRVQFYDGVGWKLINPDSAIGAVPYSGYAGSAKKFAGKDISEFAMKSILPPATCAADEIVTFNGTGFTCVADGTSGGVVGSLTGTAPITVTGSAGALVVGASVGTGANTLAAGNDSRFSDMRVPVDGSVTSAKILDGTITVSDLAPGAANGQVFRFETGQWTHSKLKYTDLVNGAGGSPWPVGYCSAGQFITWASASDSFVCSAISVSSGMVTGALGYTPVNPLREVKAGTGLTGGGDLSADRTFAVDVGTGALQIPQLDSSGKLNSSVLPTSITGGVWDSAAGNVYRSTGRVGIGTSTPANKLDVVLSDGETVRFGAFGYKDGWTGEFLWNGSAFMTINAGSLDTAFKGSVSSVGGFVTGNANYLSKSVIGSSSSGAYIYGYDGIQFDNRSYYNAPTTFSMNGVEVARVNSNGNVGIGTTTPTKQLEVAGTIQGAELCIGSVCRTTWPSVGGGGTVTSIVAGTGLDGGTINTTGTISISSGGVTDVQLATDAVTTAKIKDGNVTGAKLETVASVTPGVYGSATAVPTITVDSKGRVTAASVNSITGLLPTPVAQTGKFLGSDGSAWSAQNLHFNDIKKTDGTSAFNIAGCGAHQTINWTSLTDSFTCLNIGSLPASAISSGVLHVDRIPAAITNGMWESGAGHVYRSTGRVGIGTGTPTQALDVNGNIFASGSIKVPTQSGLIEIGDYGTLSETKGGLAYITGNAVRASLTEHNKIQKMAYDPAQFIRMRYDQGISFHTNVAGVPGDSFDDNVNNRLMIALNGNIGIGTASPAGLLDAVGDSATIRAYAKDSGNASIEATSTYGVASFRLTNGVGTQTISGGAGGTSNISFQINGSEKMRLDYDGRLGVGTLAPTDNLHVVDSSKAGVIRVEGAGSNETRAEFIADRGGSVSGAGLKIVTGATTDWFAGVGYNGGNPASTFIIDTDRSAYNGAKFSVTTDGKVGIGTANPATSLHVYKNGGDAEIGFERGSNNNASYLGYIPQGPLTSSNVKWLVGMRETTNDFSIGSYDGSMVTQRLYLTNTGNLGIGVVNPTQRIAVYNGSTTGTYTTTGWLHSSDIRLKHDIVPLENSLEKILSLRGVQYKFNSDPTDHTQVGFIAQEAEAVFPEVVVTDDKGFKSMAYGNLVAPLVEAVKEINRRLTALLEASRTQSREIASLKAEVKRLSENEIAKNQIINKYQQEQSAKDLELQQMKSRLDKIEKALGSK